MIFFEYEIAFVAGIINTFKFNCSDFHSQRAGTNFDFLFAIHKTDYDTSSFVRMQGCCWGFRKGGGRKNERLEVPDCQKMGGGWFHKN